MTTQQTYESVKQQSFSILLAKSAVFISVIYMTLIRYVMFEASYVLSLSGLLLVIPLTYSFLARGRFKPKELPAEIILLVLFQFTLLITGAISSPDLSYHISTWLSVSKYFVLAIGIATIIIRTHEYEWFVKVIFIVTVMTTAIFLINPLDIGHDRYSLSEDLNPNNLGIWLSFGCWSVLYLISKGKLNLLVGFSLIGIVMYAIFLTGSRKSLISVLVIISFWFMLYYLPLRQKNIAVFRVISAMIIFYGLTTLLLPYYTESILGVRMHDIGMEFGEDRGRWGLYQYGWEVFLESPIVGYGYGGFRLLYGRFYSHATLIEIPVSSGVVGSVLYFGAYLLILAKLYKITFQNNRFEDIQEKVVESRLILILYIMMLFYSTVIIHPYDINSMAIMGLVIGAANDKR